jgi:hypothetical protein
MELTKLLGLRPKLQTAESIAAAIAQAETLHGQAVAREAELKAGRGALLLDGSAKEVDAGERELAEVRAEAERLGVMIEALKPKLEHAKLQEKAAAFRKKVEQLEKDAAQFVAWWTSRYPELANEIREGLLIEERAEQALRKLSSELSADPKLSEVVGGALPKRPFNRLNPDPLGVYSMQVMGIQTRLRPIAGDHSQPIWGAFLR